MSRKARNAVIAAFLFILLPLVYVADRHFVENVRTAVQQAATQSTDRQKYHGRAFRVIEIIDGDTFDVDIPDANFPDTRIRLLGVDTPETRHPTIGVMYYGKEATEFTTRAVLNQEVTILLDTVGDQRDRYGRLLAYVKLPNGATLNEQLIREGCGYAYLPYRHSDYDDYNQLMTQAINEKRGLWKDVKRDQLPKWLQQKRPDLLR